MRIANKHAAHTSHLLISVIPHASSRISDWFMKLDNVEEESTRIALLLEEWHTNLTRVKQRLLCARRRRGSDYYCMFCLPLQIPSIRLDEVMSATP